MACRNLNYSNPLTPSKFSGSVAVSTTCRPPALISLPHGVSNRSRFFPCALACLSGEPDCFFRQLCRLFRDRGGISRRSIPASFGLTLSSLSKTLHLGGLHRSSQGLLGPALSPQESILLRLRTKCSCLSGTGIGGTDWAKPTVPSFLPNASWRTTAFPSSDYYDDSDASQVSLPDCWEHLFQGSLSRL